MVTTMTSVPFKENVFGDFVGSGRVPSSGTGHDQSSNEAQLVKETNWAKKSIISGVK